MGCPAAFLCSRQLWAASPLCLTPRPCARPRRSAAPVPPAQGAGQSVEALQAKVRELETMQELIQQELTHVSTAASERGARLKCAARAARCRARSLPAELRLSWRAGPTEPSQLLGLERPPAAAGRWRRSWRR